MQRRDVLRWLSSGVGAGGVAFAPSRGLAFQPPSAAAPAARGLPPLRITDVKTVLT
ncbi:MAG: starvation-sensing protein RspA, partial [Acidobacteria bacterium]